MSINRFSQVLTVREKPMSEMEKEIPLETENQGLEADSGEATQGSLADQLAALTADNAAEGESANVADHESLNVEFAAADLDFMDAPEGEVAAEPLAETQPETQPETLENPMIVGEAEQLPMLGLEEGASELEEEESSEEPTEFIDHDKMVSIVESLLFSTDKPLSMATFKALFKGSNIRTKDIQRALDQLASSYAAPDKGVTLEEIHGGFQLRTKVDNTEYLKRLAKVRPFRLSGPALEVLAITAYKQPITKTEVDQIRGVESGHLMRALMERGMVSFGEKSDLPGRPMTYVTTRKFLETFGLRNLKELPTLAEIDDLLPEGIGGEEEKETLSDLTSSLSTEVVSSYSVAEDELQDISESLKVIDTTSEFFEQEKIRQRVERDRERAQDIRERLTVGEDVEEKDRRWLSRYEAKQEQMAQAAQAGETSGPLIVDDETGDQANEMATPSVAGELAALSDESMAADVMEAADGEMAELDGRLDYDDAESYSADEPADHEPEDQEAEK